MASKWQRAVAVQQDPRWALIRARDGRADGRFVYAVETTGIYCLPSCGARPAKPENVVFYLSAALAERAGYRACKRCKPAAGPTAARDSARIGALCRLIESSDEEPSLQQLAEHAGLSPGHVQRLFKRVAGVTPKAYAAARRAERVRGELAGQGSITHALYRAGYNASSRFYEQSSALLGMTPSEYRAGGAGQALRFAVAECSLGSVLVAATQRGVCAILLGDDPQALIEDLQRRFSHAELLGADTAFEQLVARVVGLIEHPLSPVTLPLDIAGTAFQRRVWEALSAIPAGATRSYSQIAQALGQPQAARAVAGACAANALAVAVPCHRVVRTDGSLSGYRWGIERKRQLLDRERGEVSGQGR